MKKKKTKVISFINQKGGCGKSTASQHHAICLASKGDSVLFIDTDKQGTCQKFFQLNDKHFPHGYDGVIDFISSFDEEIESDLLKYIGKYDYIVIDTSPRIDMWMGIIIRNSDLVIIPCQLKRKDIEASYGVVDAIKRFQNNGSNIEARFLITRFKTNVNHDVAIGELIDTDIRILNSRMREYNGYDKADRDGVSIIHHDSYNSSKAAYDIHQITNEIKQVIENKLLEVA